VNATANPSVVTTPASFASVLERLGHHRVGEHGEDRAGREGEHERDDVRGGVWKSA
jgi:hypothetical protein